MDVLNGGWAPSKRHAFALPVIQGNRWVGHEIQPNILRARPFRLYRYTGREERNLELLQRLYRVRREMLLNMMPG